MPSPRSADHPAAQVPERGTVEALLAQARRLRGGIEGVRPDSGEADLAALDDPGLRWRRVLCDLAVHHLDDLDQQLGRLHEELAGGPSTDAPAGPAVPPDDARPAGRSRMGSAEWNFLTDEVVWSDELCRIFGRDPGEGGLSLDELPGWLLPDDQHVLTGLVTDCLVDGKPLDGEFRIRRADGGIRTLRMVGEPVLDADGATASMWAVLHDVSELRRTQRAAGESYDAVRHQRQAARTEQRIAVQLQEAVLPPWRGPLCPGPGTPAGVELAAHHLPAAAGAPIGGGWYDALPLAGGRTLLTVGDLTGHGVAAATGMALVLGALRGMAVAGLAPGPLLGGLNQLLDTSAQPALGSAVCAIYDPETRTLDWAQAGHPAPLLFRDGTGRALGAPDGVLLGATSGAVYGQAREELHPGDVLVLHTDGLAPRDTGPDPAPGAGPAPRRLLELAPRFARARTAQECVRVLVEAFGGREREDDACLLVVRIPA
ncbi:SpoIIE family protein phosphatase [Streptomyces pactum]|uniref:SpoIIE family protein phosphatase n=1 Tax=Streptomyces pactum TaxID=68249 RepID=A0ABS0NF13_9ACTN|nr:SpoIIE family protein phosphatase [Streptomyces pactum]MBH5333785.1 SpoIIE family protein phosphatase [Streptomyces pactum]